MSDEGKGRDGHRGRDIDRGGLASYPREAEMECQGIPIDHCQS